MTKIEIAVQEIREFCENPDHGYTQDATRRWGPDGDCSSFTIMAWEKAGVPVREAGASFTGDMREAFLSCGFVDVTSSINLDTGEGLQAGDVCLRDPGHVAMAVGGGMIAQAQSNEFGGKTGGKTGDQTGNEMAIKPYYNSCSGWKIMMRYTEDAFPLPGKYPLVRFGYTGPEVLDVQKKLTEAGYWLGRLDSQFGANVEFAVNMFQQDNGITSDGVVGDETRTLLATAGGFIILKSGSAGGRVNCLQRRLKKLGYFTGDIGGNFGPLTTTALKAFQKAKGLKVDGVFGPISMAAL